MKFNPFKIVKNRQNRKRTLEFKAKQFDEIHQYLISCIEVIPDYVEIKNKQGTVLDKYLKETEIKYNINVDKLYEFIGVKLNTSKVEEDNNNVNL